VLCISPHRHYHGLGRKTTGLNRLPNIPDVPQNAEVRVTTPVSPLAKISSGKLLQVLGVWFGIAAAVGNTIAAGIVRTPGVIAKTLQNPWFFLGVWVIGGLYALFGASSMAELGAAIPRSGGQYNFSRRAIGDYAGFIVGWSDWLSSCGTLAAVAIVIGEYSGKLILALAGGDRTIKTIAVSVIVGFGILQWRGVRWGSRAQLLTSAMKTAAFVILVIACFALG
jgi:APA family basic amino acid/polyamine antiporter